MASALFRSQQAAVRIRSSARLRRVMHLGAACGSPGAGGPRRGGFAAFARHTWASLALASGKSTKSMAAQLGHSNPGFTPRTYAQVMPEEEPDVLFADFGGPGLPPRRRVQCAQERAEGASSASPEGPGSLCGAGAPPGSGPPCGDPPPSRRSRRSPAAATPAGSRARSHAPSLG
jgi:hypothetical protein